jgi:hypothetical protein
MRQRKYFEGYWYMHMLQTHVLFELQLLVDVQHQIGLIARPVPVCGTVLELSVTAVHYD